MLTSTQAQERRAINAAARVFFRSGPHALNQEQRDLLTTSDAAGGAFVSQAFDTAFLEASKYFGPVFNLVHRKDSENGEPTKFAQTDPTGQTFSLLSEGSTSAYSKKQTPSVFSDVTNTATLISSVVYSLQELKEAFDLEAFLIRTAGLAVSRAREVAVTAGITNDGTSTALPNNPAGGMLAGVTAGVTQGSGTLSAGVTQAQLLNLSASVDRSYFENGAYMASPSVESALRAQTDTTGRLLYPIDDATGLLRIGGKLLYPNTAMAANGTASSPLVLFGDYSRFYSVLNAGGVKIRVLTENSPTLPFMTREMLIYTRIGATTGVANSVKALVSAAS